MISTTPWDSSVRRWTTSDADRYWAIRQVERKPELFGRPPVNMLASSCFATEFFSCEIEDFTGFVALVGRYAPVNDHGLGDVLPDGRCGKVAVVQRPVVLAACVVRLAHHHDHRELGVDGGQEAHVRRPDVQRGITIYMNLRPLCLF